MKRKYKDFNVQEFISPVRGTLYAVYMAKNILIATYRDEETATTLCANLNIDPWYLDKKDWKEYKSARISYTPTLNQGY